MKPINQWKIFKSIWPEKVPEATPSSVEVDKPAFADGCFAPLGEPDPPYFHAEIGNLSDGRPRTMKAYADFNVNPGGYFDPSLIDKAIQQGTIEASKINSAPITSGAVQSHDTGAALAESLRRMEIYLQKERARRYELEERTKARIAGGAVPEGWLQYKGQFVRYGEYNPLTKQHVPAGINTDDVSKNFAIGQLEGDDLALLRAAQMSGNATSFMTEADLAQSRAEEQRASLLENPEGGSW